MPVNQAQPMAAAEVLARSEAFDPTAVDPCAVMRLELTMIAGRPLGIDPVDIATLALAEVQQIEQVYA